LKYRASFNITPPNRQINLNSSKNLSSSTTFTNNLEKSPTYLDARKRYLEMRNEKLKKRTESSQNYKNNNNNANLENEIEHLLFVNESFNDEGKSYNSFLN